MGNAGRKKRIAANALVGIIGQILTILIGFVSRKIFILYLGQNLSGLGSTFTNVLSFLNLATTGISSVAQYKIFQYNAENDTENLNKVYYFMRTMYSTVSLGIFLVGGLLSFKIDWIIHDNPFSNQYLQIVFLLMLAGDCISYLYAHIRAFLAAMEQLFVYNIIYTGIYLGMTVCNLIAVMIWKNYYLYLMILILQNVLIGVILALFVRSHFSFLYPRNREKFQDSRQLLGEIRNVLPRAVAKFVYNSTDNMVISAFLGLISVNIFVNYTMITYNVHKLASHFSNALRFSIGNALFEKDGKNALWGYVKLVTCAEFAVASTLSAITFGFIDYFIGDIWLGSEFLAGTLVRNLLCIELYLKLMGEPLITLMNVTGKFRDDKVAYCFASACNLVISIFLVRSIGLPGVIVGTLVSEIMMFCYRASKLLEEKAYYPKFICMQATMLIITLIEAGVVYQLNHYVVGSFGFLGAIVLGVVMVAVLPCIGLLAGSRYYNMLPIVQKTVKRFIK